MSHKHKFSVHIDFQKQCKHCWSPHSHVGNLRWDVLVLRSCILGDFSFRQRECTHWVIELQKADNVTTWHCWHSKGGRCQQWVEEQMWHLGLVWEATSTPLASSWSHCPSRMRVKSPGFVNRLLQTLVGKTGNAEGVFPNTQQQEGHLSLEWESLIYHGCPCTKSKGRGDLHRMCIYSWVILV